jgi:hypothetical protein
MRSMGWGLGPISTAVLCVVLLFVLLVAMLACSSFASVS